MLVSTDIHQCFSTFSDFYATRLAILYMDLSFQLNLFVDYELPYVFWAYSDVLYRRIYGYCRSRNQNVVCSVNYQRPNTADYVKAQVLLSFMKKYGLIFRHESDTQRTVCIEHLSIKILRLAISFCSRHWPTTRKSKYRRKKKTGFGAVCCRVFKCLPTRN